MGRRWTTAEEELVREKAGLLSAKDIARLLGRTVNAVVIHAYRMREEGRLDYGLSTRQEHFNSWLEECCECHRMRYTVDRTGTCGVCRKKEQLESNLETMRRAWVNLPPPLRARAKRDCMPRRAPSLMSKSSKIKYPQKPDISAMNDFDAAAAMDEWLVEVEKYETAMLKLDIDAVKQRTCKWRRKTREYRESIRGLPKQK